MKNKMLIKRIMDLCERRGFLNKLSNALNIGPVGTLLQENLKNEWFYNMIINRDNTVFFCNNNNSFSATFDFAKDVCQGRLPFGIAGIVEEKTTAQNLNGSEFDFNKYLTDKRFLLQTTMFVAPSSATQFFHRWQRERKMWWRKFSASPGRYFLSDIRTHENGNQSVEIKAEYPWGVQLNESIFLSNLNDTLLSPKQLEALDGRKKVQAHSVSSTISLTSMFLNAICDSYDESNFNGNTRPLLRLHRKLAPYKISFSTLSSDDSTEELEELALYLCRKLRTNQVSSLLLPSSLQNNLDEEFLRYDQLGVPYTVVLNRNTLKDGIVLLRNRDTTLKEQVHISNLPEYVQMLFKNY